MAEVLDVGDRLQHKIYCQDNEQGSVNTVYDRVLTVVGVVTDHDVAVSFDTAINGAIKALITTGVLYQGVTVRIANRLPLPVAQAASLNAGAGTAGAPGLPRQAAGLLDLRTDIAGPGGRGRLYIPFPDATHNENQGVPKASYVTLLEALGSDLIGFTTVTVGAASATLSLQVWSKVHNRMQKVTDFFGVTKWATMKKRGSFGRPNQGPFG